MTSLLTWQHLVFVDITDGDVDAKYQMVMITPDKVTS